MPQGNLPAATQRRLRPDRWAGEADCHVGPFRDRRVAERFANALVDFGRYETFTERVISRPDGVFVEIRRSGA